jgi:hypothetical protein
MRTARATSTLLATAGALTALWTGSGRAATVAAPPPGSGRATTVAAPPAGPDESASAGAIVALSNEVTSTTWAHPEIAGAIRVAPSPHARPVARVRLYTEDGFPEVYPLLSRLLDAAGREWVRVRVPGRPNGRTGWMLRELLGELHRTHWRIVVDRERRRMSVYYDGQLRRVFPVGVGKPSTPTPPGHFWVRERFKLSGRNNPYGPFALGTSDYSTLSEWPGGGVVGIHGDFGEPRKIPGDPSHGCIRMHDADIGWLGPRVALGTPVQVV